MSNPENRYYIHYIKDIFIKCLQVALVYLLLAIYGSYAQEENFIYDGKGKRDPFIPLITDKTSYGTAIGLMSVETIEDITLEGIIWDPAGSSLVMLNGVILKEKDQAYNVKVSKIERDRVTILINDQEFTLKLFKKGED